MENKDIFIIIGLTVILAVAVSIATIGITGNVVYKWDPSTQSYLTGQPYVQDTQSEILAQQRIITALSKATIGQAVGQTTCSAQCNSMNKQCIMALYNTQDSTVLVECDKRVVTGRYNILTCACVSL